MKRLIQELRRRQVFRAAGLYFGVCWVIIEVASVVLPEMDAPSWVFRTLLGLSIAGFPVAMVLAWVYDVAEGKITLEEDAPTVAATMPGRQADFVVIGVLVVALGFSVWLNVNEEIDPADIPTMSLLIADFDNRTDQELFSGSVEQALSIGVEGAPFVTAYPRKAALEAAESIREQPVEKLDDELVYLIGVREGVGGVLIGTIESSGSGYRLNAKVVQPQSQATLAEADAKAESAIDVLSAVNELARDLRSDLGDASIDDQEELFTVQSLEAAKEYVIAQQLHLEGKDEQARLHYQKATELDPEFGRAYSGWALSEFRLGRMDESEALWQKALGLMDRMTERERLRTLGLYYLVVSKNYKKAVENYQQLVDKYPADSGGHNNLAIAHFYLREFEQAQVEGGKALDIYPGKLIFKSNYALYAMYAGQFEAAAEQAREIIDLGKSVHKSYLPLAVAAVDQLKLDDARAAYNQMAEIDAKGASLALMGLADLAIFEGKFDQAQALLAEGAAVDEQSGNQRGAGRKLAALAEVYEAQGNSAAAQLAIARALEMVRNEATLLTAATLHMEGGRAAEAQSLADELNESLRPESRAYGKLIEGRIARLTGEHGEASDFLGAALSHADLWLAHFEQGLVYLEAGYLAEALSEFQICDARRGEAYAVFLDDVPTVRFTANLAYWLGRSADELGLSRDAVKSFERFLAARSLGTPDPLVMDATARLRKLKSSVTRGARTDKQLVARRDALKTDK